MSQQQRPDRPTWDVYWAKVGSEEYLAAKALLELSSIQLDAEQWLEWHRDEMWDDDHNPAGWSAPYPTLDWDEWVRDVVEQGRGWSSTEHRLFRLVAALVATDPPPFALRDTLGYMGSWEKEVWRILVDWGTGGNNRDYPGRATVISTRH